MGTNSDPIGISDASDDSSDESMYSYGSDSDMPGPRRGMFTLRGPFIRGNEAFDEHCVFGNTMELNGNQVLFLKNITQLSPGVPIKYYVYKMSNSSVISKECKMEFELEFTKSYLKRYLHDPIYIHVGSTTDSKKLEVRMELGLGSEKAIITSGWDAVVERFLLTENDIQIFSFLPCVRGGLHLLIMYLEP